VGVSSSADSNSSGGTFANDAASFTCNVVVQDTRFHTLSVPLWPKRPSEIGTNPDNPDLVLHLHAHT
jgi:hypothetical protein